MDRFQPNSFFAFLNNFYYIKDSLFEKQKQRPRFPPLNENPSFQDLLMNFNKGDFGTIFLLGIPIFHSLNKQVIENRQKIEQSIRVQKNIEIYSHQKKMIRGNFVYTLSICLLFGLYNGYNRQIGRVRNGQQWKYPSILEILKQFEKINIQQFQKQFH